MRRTIVLALALLGSLTHAETRKLPITADVGICAYKDEKSFNTGAQPRVRIKGNDHYYLFGFDAKQVANWRIDKAALHMKLSQGRPRRAGICTVPIAWVEGAGAGKPENGATCFTHVKYPDVPWTAAGGTMLDATFNSPYMMWRAADVTVGKDNWIEIPIAPELVLAVAAGLSHGLALAEDKGQAGENQDVFTREQSNARPYLEVEGGPVIAPPSGTPCAPMGANPCPGAAGLKTGAIEIDLRLDPNALAAPWTGGTLVGSRISIALKGGKQPVREIVTLGDPVVIVEGLEPGGTYLVSGTTITTRASVVRAPSSPDAAVVASPALPPLVVPDLKPPDSTKRQTQGAGWVLELHPVCAKLAPDAKCLTEDRGWPVPPAPRNAWLGLQAAIFPPDGKADGVSVELTAIEFQGLQGKEVAPLRPVRLFRTWYVGDGKAWHAEALVPLKTSPSSADPPAEIRGSVSEKLSIPWGQNQLPAHSCQALLIDIWVRKDATPGPYEGKLVVKQDGKELAAIPIRLEVAGTTLPDYLSVVGDMNAYKSPAVELGLKESDPAAFMEGERKYYRLAHAHRMTLNVLPYSQSGNIAWRGAPKIEGTGRDCKVTDWSEWDERFGPLLSGTAFDPNAGYVGPGANTPIHHMYLPFHENWPSKLAEHFKPWPPPKDYDELKKWLADLPPVWKCLDLDHLQAWVRVLAALCGHVQDRRWYGTHYHVYLNNKYYFRDPKQGARGVSLWLLDEPMYADDFIALNWFGGLTNLFGDPGRKDSPQVSFRIDISRPTHQRNWLDRVVNLNVVADQLYTQRRLIEYRKRKFHEEYWNYAMPKSFQADNVGWWVWPIQSYCWGATGTLPWQTIGSDGSFQKAEDTSLMYPGKRFALDEPLPSLRMKAWRDGLQDAELLRMLREKMKWNDVQLRAFVGQACGLEGTQDGMDPQPDAPIVVFKGMDALKLLALRRVALLMLEAK